MMTLGVLVDRDACSGALIELNETVETAAERMKRHHRDALVVTERGAPVGIITRRDIFSRVIARHRSPLLAVREVMSRDLIAAAASQPVEDALALINAYGIGHLLVVDADDRLLGILTRVQLISGLAAEREAQIDDLMFYITRG